MLSVQVKRISSRKIQDQLPDYDWSESLDPLSNPHLLEWLRDQERAFQVCTYFLKENLYTCQDGCGVSDLGVLNSSTKSIL